MCLDHVEFVDGFSKFLKFFVEKYFFFLVKIKRRKKGKKKEKKKKQNTVFANISKIQS